MSAGANGGRGVDDLGLLYSGRGPSATGGIVGRTPAYTVNGVERTYGALVEGFDYGNYLRTMIGDAPAGMVNPHAHHILFKTGLGTDQQILVAQGQHILRKVGIDPIYGVENLVWAPNRIPGQHDLGALTNVVDKLKELDTLGGDYDDFVELLRELGELAASR